MSQVAAGSFQEMIPDRNPVEIQSVAATEPAPFNLVLVIVSAAIAAAAAAALWAAITVVSGLQIGWMAVGVGFLVGIVVRVAGASTHSLLGFVGAFFALLGCLAGNVLAFCGMVATETGLPWTQVLLELDLPAVKTLLVLNFQPVDVLFYGLALYFGFKLSRDSD